MEEQEQVRFSDAFKIEVRLGQKGVDGKSAFELWKEKSGNENKSEEDFFNELTGDTKLNTTYDTYVDDLNTLSTEGIYNATRTTLNGPPIKDNPWGRVMVLNSKQTGQGIKDRWIYQVFFNNLGYNIWWRKRINNGQWVDWVRIPTDNDLTNLATTIETKTKVPAIEDMDLIFDGSKLNGGFGASNETINFTKPWDTYDTLYIIYFSNDKSYILNTTVNVAIAKHMLETGKKMSISKLRVIGTYCYKTIAPNSTSTQWVDYNTNMYIKYIYGYKQGK